MFRPTDPQTSLLATSHFLPDDKRERLEKDWPGQFRTRALPLIDEEKFRDFYCPDNGRPNKPVETVVGVLLLKEMNNLTDAEALFNLDFNLAWHVALDLEPEKAHTCQKTLHNFRAKLMASDRARLLFEDMTGKIIEALGVSTDRQRLDSTHIISNVATLTRLGLFCETARVFLRELGKTSKEKYDAVPPGLLRRYLRDGGERSSYDDARSSEGRRRLRVCARDVWRLVDRFNGDEAVAALGSYGLLKRLFEEQCEVVAEPQSAAEGDADLNEAPAPVVVKAAKDVKSDSLQTPHDPSLTYSGKKGKGEEVQVAETCGNGDKPEVITYAEVTRSCDSDQDVTVPAVDDLARRDIRPKELDADTNYGSTENVIECGKRGAELVAPVPGPRADEAPAETGEGEITKADFDVDPAGERKTCCPAGHESTSETRDGETGKVRAFFDGGICAECNMRESCPAKPLSDRRAAPDPSGSRVLRTTIHAAVLVKRRRYEKTREFKERYAMRAGIEATNSELKRAHGLGRLRVRGSPRAKLAVYLKALACNVKRMVRYLAERAREATQAVSRSAEEAAEGAASSLRVILAWFGRKAAELTRPVATARGPAARTGHAIPASAA